MLFSGTVFLFVFLPAALFCYYVPLKKSRTGRNILLTALSLLFYAWGEPLFAALMLLSILINWLLVLAIEKHRQAPGRARLFLVVSIVCNLAPLFVFKYLAFVIENLQRVIHTGWLSRISPEIALPLGISFFTFKAMSYVFDVHKGLAPAAKNPLDTALYISFFPQLMAGPITRWGTFAGQLRERKTSFEGFAAGTQRFMLGICKKMLLANHLSPVADAAFAARSPSVALAWAGALAYTLQIFFDFSSYSDMAIGLGRMFGFDTPENFDYPYISKSVSEFWRRWHISLGAWFRDYLYFPLGGSRVKSKARLVFNLFMVWFLTGAWHGASWTFIAWGLMYFALIALEKLTGFEKKLGPFGRVYTLLSTVIGWVLFRAESLPAAVHYLGHMAGIGAGGLWDALAAFHLRENALFFALGLLFSLPAAPWLSKKLRASDNKPLRTACDIAYALALAALFVVSLTYIVKGAYNPFIYFNF